MLRKQVAVSLAALAVVISAAPAAAAEGPPAPRKERLSFAKGTSTATIKGDLHGGADVDYLIRAAAGQTLEVRLEASNAQNDFNVLPPGSKDVAMYSSTMTGVRTYAGVLPADGDYSIRVFLDRPAARRNESSKYVLTVSVTGHALPPLSAAADAKVAGTPYNATATVNCVPPFQTAAAQCPVGVIRRGRDGTATLDLKGPNGLQRRILFVQGKVAATDAMQAATSSRKEDTVTVEIGDERYVIPDALLTGG